jgi:Mrp family chromosome partitioning ATPase
VAISDVEKEIDFCKTVNLPIIGLIENMSGYTCQHCSHCTNIFSSGGGEQLADKHSIEFLGKLPICPAFSRLLERTDTDLVRDYPSCPLAHEFSLMFEKLA